MSKGQFRLTREVSRRGAASFPGYTLPMEFRQPLIQKQKTIRVPDGNCPQGLPNQKKSNNNLVFLLLFSRPSVSRNFWDKGMGLFSWNPSGLGFPGRKKTGASPKSFGSAPVFHFRTFSNRPREPHPYGRPFSAGTPSRSPLPWEQQT